MKIKVGDTVKIIAGKDKGKEGKVIETLRNKDRVIVEKINIVKKHVKPNGQNETGGILEMEAPIHVSNVKLVTKDSKKKEKETKKESKAKAVKETKKTATAKESK